MTGSRLERPWWTRRDFLKGGGAAVAGAYGLLFTRKTLFWLRQAPQIVKHGQQEIEQNFEKALKLSLIINRQLPTKLYHLEPVNSCRLVKYTRPVRVKVSRPRSMGIGLPCMCPKAAN